jgi:formylglycine-generating enzyme
MNTASVSSVSLTSFLVVLATGCFSPNRTPGMDTEAATETSTGTGDPGTTDPTADSTGPTTTITTDPVTTDPSTTSTTDPGTGSTGEDTTGGEEDLCPAASEGCPCGIGSSCDTELECTPAGICVAPGMVYVAAGAFEMGCNDEVDDECLARESPYHTVTLSPFSIDVTAVTQAQYADCVAAGMCTAPGAAYDPDATPEHPVTALTYAMARSYCLWAEKELPTEAQWEKAARGDDGRKYPWGNDDLDCTRANYGTCVGGTPVDVGDYPSGESPYGLLDCIGNGGEWVRDYFDADYYASSPSDDPTGPNSGSTRVIRSQPPSAPASESRASARRASVPTSPVEGVGVRCARPHPPLPER